MLAARKHQARRLVARTIFRDLAENSQGLAKRAGEIMFQRFLVELPVVQTIFVDVIPQAHQLVNIQAAFASDDGNPVEMPPFEVISRTLPDSALARTWVP